MTPATISAYNMRIIKGIVPRVNGIKVKTIDCLITERIVSVHAHLLLLLSLLASGGDIYALPHPSERNNLTMKRMCLNIEYRLRIYPSAINHDGEQKTRAVTLTSNDSHGLTSGHPLPNLYKVLQITPVDSPLS